MQITFFNVCLVLSCIFLMIEFVKTRALGWLGLFFLALAQLLYGR